MTPELSGAYALFLSGLALLLGQRNSFSRATNGFVLAFLLLTASSLGADLLNTSGRSVSDLISPAVARIAFSGAVLALLALFKPKILASIDLIWVTWAILAISEISSLIFRGMAFRFQELFSSGIAAIVLLTIASIAIQRLVRNRKRGRHA